MDLLRVLIPSWRFFEQAGQVPQLSFRSGPTRDHLSAWVPCPPPAPRSWLHLFLNPRGNQNLAFQSLVERLVMDLYSWDEKRESEFPQSVSYRLVEHLVRFHLSPQHASGIFQFKIQAGEEDVLFSEEHDIR